MVAPSYFSGDPVCYTALMFMHNNSITGRSDRGAWPWRTSYAAFACARLRRP